MLTFELAVLGGLAIGFVLMVCGTLARNRWGINPAEVACPHCAGPQPGIRRPRSLEQAMWGGWTCARCETRADKWGRELARPQSV